MRGHEAFVIRTAAQRHDDHARVTLTVDLPDGVHIEPHQPPEPYLIPTVVDVDGTIDVTVEYPEPVVKDLGWQDARLIVLEGTVQFVISGRVPDEQDRLSGTLRYQPCIGGACLPPRTVQWSAPLTGTTTYSVLHALAA